LCLGDIDFIKPAITVRGKGSVEREIALEKKGIHALKSYLADGALRAIAQAAWRRKTGARGLRAILEELLLDTMYDLPSRTDVREGMVTEDDVHAVTERQQPVLLYKQASYIRPHSIGTLVAHASVEYRRIRVVKCPHLLWADVDVHVINLPMSRRHFLGGIQVRVQ